MGATDPASKLGKLLLHARETYLLRKGQGSEKTLSASGAGVIASQWIARSRLEGCPWASNWEDGATVTRHYVENSEAGRRNPLRDITRLRGLVEGLEITPVLAIDEGLLEVMDRGRIQALAGSAWLTALLVGRVIAPEDLNV